MNIFEHYGIDWLAGLMTILGIYLLGSKKKAGFVVMMTGNITYIAFGLIANSSGVIVANLVFILMNIRGFISWTKK
ncbi:MAG: PnuC protein [Phycisphaerae bacterium]|nr:PnuC protein [Phycisphaerae bacterium]